MATTCTLVYSATTVTLKAPDTETDHTMHVPSDGIQTGGGYYGYRFGTNWDEFELSFTNLTKAQVDSLIDFYTTTVKGRALEWTYNDAAGNAGKTARFLSPPRWVIRNQAGNGQYDASIRIRTTEKVT